MSKILYSAVDCIELHRVIQSSDTWWRDHTAIFEELLVKLTGVLKERMIDAEEITDLILEAVKGKFGDSIYKKVKSFICESDLDRAPLEINDNILRPWARWRLMIRK